MLSLARSDLARVVTGQASPSALAEEGKACCEPRAALGQLDAVFPPQPVAINCRNNFFKAHLDEMGIR